ncbi:MAG: tetratricopeptide repeat protein [Acidobacteria bacterium]|nr:tetratricopeptide repeat protein [Acidobacteriota bacterium]
MNRGRAWSGRRWVHVAGLVWVAASLACAASVTPPATPSAPVYVDYVFPQPPEKGGDQRLAAQHRKAWELLQSGDLRGASNEYSALVKRAPGYVPAEVGLGYVLLAQQKVKDAMAWFDHAIRVAPGYAPGYAGRADALLAGGQRELALASFESALKIDPSLSDLGRRIEVIKFTRVRELVAVAKRAADEGQLEEARRAYTEAVQAAPDSAVLYRDLGSVETRLDAIGDAVQHLRKSVALDGGDARALTALGDALEKQGDLEGAVDAYQRALALDGSEVTRKTLDRLRERPSTTRFPAEYQSIPRLPQVTRGDLAALVGIRLQGLLAAGRRGPTVVATDVRGHWASTWIMAVTRANVMEVYANHTFQPAGAVRRVDMAQVVARLVAMIAPGFGKSSMHPTITDVPADHLSYPDVAVSVSSGIMGLVDGGMFRPSRGLTGAEAVDVVDRLERLAKKPGAGTVGGAW